MPAGVTGAQSRRSVAETLWLLPAAITFATFFKQTFEIGQTFVSLSSIWIEVCREVWRRLYALAGLRADEGDLFYFDLMTLWLLLFVALSLWPTFARAPPQNTTAQVFARSLSLGPRGARALAFLTLAGAWVLIAIPFVPAIKTLRASAFFSSGEMLAAGVPPLATFAVALIVGAVSLYSLVEVQLRVGPALDAAWLSRTERHDLVVISSALWFASAAVMVGAGFLDDNLRTDFALAGLVLAAAACVWRSAFPVVQLATLICVIVMLVAIYDQLRDIFESVARANAG